MVLTEHVDSSTIFAAIMYDTLDRLSSLSPSRSMRIEAERIDKRIDELYTHLKESE